MAQAAMAGTEDEHKQDTRGPAMCAEQGQNANGGFTAAKRNFFVLPNTLERTPPSTTTKKKKTPETSETSNHFDARKHIPLRHSLVAIISSSSSWRSNVETAYAFPGARSKNRTGTGCRSTRGK